MSLESQINTTTHETQGKPARRIVPKDEEIRRKREGTWEPLAMVSSTCAEGAALLAELAEANARVPTHIKSDFTLGVDPKSTNQCPQPECRTESTQVADPFSISIRSVPEPNESSSTTGQIEPGAIDLLHMLAPAGPWTVRTISSVESGPPKSPKKLGYDIHPRNAGDDEHGIAGWIQTAAAGKLNCYLHVAIAKPEAINKAKLQKEDVVGSRAVWTDVDAGDKHHPVADRADFAARRATILAAMQAEEPPFSCIVDSGNGFQAYKFIEPYRIDSETDRLAALEAANKAISASVNKRLEGTGLSADACHSADHLMRLPGTTNFLTTKKRSFGYPEGDRPARIIDWHPEHIYKLEDLPTTNGDENKGLHRDHLLHVDSDGAGSITEDQLKVLLDGLDAKKFSDGPRFRNVMWAAHHGTRGEGREAFVAWAATDPQFVDEQEKTRAAWDRAKDDHANGVTVATLYHELKEAGREDLIRKINPSRPHQNTRLEIGSDVEIAQRLRGDLIGRFGPIVCAEGALWRYCSTHWAPILEHDIRLAVHAYDGAFFGSPREPSRVKLGKGRIDSILNECNTLCAEPDFFVLRPVGINCASGFISFCDNGTASVEPHSPDHRCRHTLPGHWQVGSDGRPPDRSLLHRLLNGVFAGDEEVDIKISLLSEVCGAAALGYATKLKQPRAVILFGQTAENGKSQILDLARGLLPPNAVCSVPAGKMGDEKHIVGLVNKLLNASDELSPAAIASDAFKAVVTGEPIEGRDVYKSRIEFRAMAQNLFATNSLPPFLGGMDRGVQRRLLVVPFNRTIPMADRIENIGRRIANEEADILLAWAVEGASRLVRQRNFTVPPSCKQALMDWMFGADPVLAWISECVEVRPVVEGRPAISTRDAYNQFHTWAVAEGFKADKVPAINGFSQRILANTPGIDHHRTAQGRFFLGLVVKSPTKRDERAKLPF
jgi:P4 family phage/plasmid primase-like protien